VGLGFLLKIFGRGTDSGLFGYLQSRDVNKTRRLIEQDWFRTLIELERERRITARELIEQLPEGSEYRESTLVGNLEIRKVQAQPLSLFVLPQIDAEPRQTSPEQTELPVSHAQTHEQNARQELPDGEDFGCIDRPPRTAGP
jgi:hypothetical protein